MNDIGAAMPAAGPRRLDADEGRKGELEAGGTVLNTDGIGGATSLKMAIAEFDPDAVIDTTLVRDALLASYGAILTGYGTAADLSVAGDQVCCRALCFWRRVSLRLPRPRPALDRPRGRIPLCE